MSESSDVEGAPMELPVTPSLALVEAREKLGLSQKEVAEKLFLPTTIINHIEGGEFDRLPRQAFIRGYLRSYARVVKLSGDHIVELYEKGLLPSSRAPQVRGISEEKVGSAYITGPVVLTGLFGLAFLLLIIGFIWWRVAEDKPESADRIDQPIITEPKLQLDNPSVLDPVVGTTGVSKYVEKITGEEIEDDVESELVGETLLGESAAVDASILELRREPESKTATLEKTTSVDVIADVISIERNLDGEKNYIVVDAGGLDELSLTFSEECWVEVSESLHGTVYYDLNNEQDVLTVFGSSPFEVLLGKASGVQMLYNGVPFDLEPYIGPDKTAKVKLTE